MLPGSMPGWIASIYRMPIIVPTGQLPSLRDGTSLCQTQSGNFIKGRNNRTIQVRLEDEFNNTIDGSTVTFTRTSAVMGIWYTG